jgi:Phospholipase A1
VRERVFTFADSVEQAAQAPSRDRNRSGDGGGMSTGAGGLNSRRWRAMKIRGYAQQFSGYGESLLDYDHDRKRVGSGIVLTDIL